MKVRKIIPVYHEEDIRGSLILSILSFPEQCIAAVVIVALVASVQAGLAYNPVYTVPQATVVQQNVVPKYVTAYSAPAVTYASYAVAPAVSYASHVSAPVSYAAHNTVIQAAPVAYAAPTAYAYENAQYVPQVYASVQKEASYVAATRGAVHVAPLAGHAVNQKSLNVEAAPGTL
ncbi:AGAP008460-PA-like protein [Anopheles sinensis]|uniref:AGAP008460-PA-like protein n=1 Tax=Anopheles sinensis TaxID=74873 RepID=A0A084VL41_ANOSI|nr:AGAP008460-PA-like protein [Anopheles sinensis]